MAGLTRRSARVRTKASRVHRVQEKVEKVKIARRPRTVTPALAEVHSNFLAKSSTSDTQVKTKFKTSTVDAIHRMLL